MTWQMITQSFDKIIDTLSKGLINGSPEIEQMRCVYKIDDSNIIYNLSAFDFIDLDPKKDSIKEITLYQLIDKKSIS